MFADAKLGGREPRAKGKNRARTTKGSATVVGYARMTFATKEDRKRQREGERKGEEEKVSLHP